jgi:hypothetical protein
MQWWLPIETHVQFFTSTLCCNCTGEMMRYSCISFENMFNSIYSSFDPKDEVTSN